MKVTKGNYGVYEGFFFSKKQLVLHVRLGIDVMRKPFYLDREKRKREKEKRTKNRRRMNIE